MGTNLVKFTMRRIGSSILFGAEPEASGRQSFVMHTVQVQRLRTEYDVLTIVERAGIGRWSNFPPDGIQATVTRDQLWAMGFRGIY